MNIFARKLQEMEELKSQEKRSIFLKGEEINLTRIGIDFLPNNDQIEILNGLADFFETEEYDEMVLEGPAGSGKTSIIKILLQYFRQVQMFRTFTLTAPTNRAKSIIEALSGKDSTTLHSLLGLFPDMNIEKLDLKRLNFDTKNSEGTLMPGSCLIVDEGSMVNDDLNELITYRAKQFKVKVLYMGDSHQLKPVGQKHISKVFSLPKRLLLTKIERQSATNKGMHILANLRKEGNDEMNYLELSGINKNKNGVDEGFLFTNKASQFIEHITNIFSSEQFQKDKLYGRILCYTRKKTDVYNKMVRDRLGFTGTFQEGELLIAHDNYQIDNPLRKIINSCDYVIEKLVDTTVVINEIELPASYLYLRGVQTKNKPEIVLLDSRTPLDFRERLAEEIEALRVEGLYRSKKEGPRAWIPYLELKNSFCSTFDLFYEERTVKNKLLDFGYSVTIHKSQGGTFSNTLVDMKDIKTATDPLDLKQLRYTALSRAKHVTIGFTD